MAGTIIEFGAYADLELSIYSRYFRRRRKVLVLLPPSYHQQPNQHYPVLYMNDGQDAERMRVKETLAHLYKHDRIQEVIVVAIPAKARLKEYGTAGIPDYANRGNKASLYTRFITHELVPTINRELRTLRKPSMNAFVGCSLGGLSAFDICFHHPDLFKRVGVFSGSFWWRRHSENNAAADIDRIMHGIVRQSTRRDGLKFWFEVGTEDEKEDRNNNGIIDAIEDTLDLMTELEGIGYHRQHDMRYLEVQGGQHNQETWSKVLPDFLIWAFSRELNAYILDERW